MSDREKGTNRKLQTCSSRQSIRASQGDTGIAQTKGEAVQQNNRTD
jgi:hypothetical protein